MECGWKCVETQDKAYWSSVTKKGRHTKYISVNNKDSIKLSEPFPNAICSESRTGKSKRTCQSRVTSNLLGQPLMFWKHDYKVLENLPANEYLTANDRHIIKSLLVWTPLVRTDIDQISQTEGLADALRSFLWRNWGNLMWQIDLIRRTFQT